MDCIESRPEVVYIVAQLAGGNAAALVFVGIRGPEAVTIGGMGATVAFPGVAQWQAALNEIVITFFLMAAVMAMAIDDRTPDQFAGLMIGFVVAIGVVTTGNISGASFNPARTIGPYVANTVIDGNVQIWTQVWIYIVGPTVGAVLAAYFYDSVVLEPFESAEPREPSPDRRGEEPAD